MKINQRTRRVDTETKIRVATDYNGKMPIAIIAKKYSISLSTLYRILREAMNDAF